MLLFTCFVLSFVSWVAILQFRFQFCKWQNDDLASRNILHNHYDHLWRYLSYQNLSSFFSIILILTKKILDFWVEKSKMLLKCAMFLKCDYHFEVQIFFLTSRELFENVISLVRQAQCWFTIKMAASSWFEKSKSSSKFF